MALKKVHYVDGQTVITAEQLNAIQDAIIALENGKAFRFIERYTATEEAQGIVIMDLDLELPISIRIKNTGENAGTGLGLSVNGVGATGSNGTMSTTGVDFAGVRAWLWKEGGKMLGKAQMANDAINNYDFGEAPERVNGIEIQTVNQGVFQDGTVLEIYAGVFPNVK
jgi:hypothetical protein